MRTLLFATALLFCSSLAHATVTECSDGVDNDGDGYIDLEDPGCGGNPNASSELPFNQTGFDLSGTASDLGSADMPPGDDDAGNGFMPPADAGHFGGAPPAPGAPGTTGPVANPGCEYFTQGDVPLGGVLVILAIIGAAVVLSRRSSRDA